MSTAGPVTAAPVRHVTVALCGRPNSGKTSLLMRLTGVNLKPVNFPGTSVERVESSVQVGELELRCVDLPGVLSLQPVSRDEAVAIDYLRAGSGTGPDLLCAVLDASKLSVELHLLQQLRRLGRPVVVALTKQDVAAAQGMPVDAAALQKALGLPLLEVNNRTGSGVDELRALLAQGGNAVPETTANAAGDAAQIAAGVQDQRRSRRTFTDRIDAVLLHPLAGPIALCALILLLFETVFTVAEPFVSLVERGQAALGTFVTGLLPEGVVQSFLVDGLINGLGSVLVFVPQIALLIALVTFLESTGYMARAVFLLDRLLRRFGLTGRSFVPLTSSFACAIPGILAARIIDDERDRLATIAVAPLMSCSARLPVYVVLIGAFFSPAMAPFVLLGMYLLGIAVAVVVALVLRRTVLKGGRSMLAMELPVYQPPAWRVIAVQAGIAAKQFLTTAGTVIFFATVVVWALAFWPRPDAIHGRFEVQRAALADAEPAARRHLDDREQAEYLEQSWLARIGKTVQPVFAPCGFDWRITVGILASFPARELIIPTLGTLHSLGKVETGDFVVGSMTAGDREEGLRGALRHARDPQGRPAMNSLVALGLMAFFALCSQCASTLAVMRKETHSWRWPAFAFSYMTALAWLVAAAIYQLGSLLGFGLPK